jgi:hypothetical protein
VIVWLGTLVFAIIEGGRRGWTSPGILACFGVAPVTFVGLVFYELRRREPLVEVRFFRSVPFSGASATAICAFGGIGGFIFLGTLYLQAVRGFSALHAGLYSLPMALTMLVLAPLSGGIVGSRGSRWPLVVGGALLTAGPLLLVGLDVRTSAGVLLASYLVVGAGMGLVNPPVTTAAISGMPADQAGVASAITSTSRQVVFARRCGHRRGDRRRRLRAFWFRFCDGNPFGLGDHLRLGARGLSARSGDDYPVGAANGPADGGAVGARLSSRSRAGHR